VWSLVIAVSHSFWLQADAYEWQQTPNFSILFMREHYKQQLHKATASHHRGDWLTALRKWLKCSRYCRATSDGVWGVLNVTWKCWDGGSSMDETSEPSNPTTNSFSSGQQSAATEHGRYSTWLVQINNRHITQWWANHKSNHKSKSQIIGKNDSNKNLKSKIKSQINQIKIILGPNQIKSQMNFTTMSIFHPP